MSDPQTTLKPYPFDVIARVTIPADKVYIVPWSAQRVGESWSDYVERACKEAVVINNVR